MTGAIVSVGYEGRTIDEFVQLVQGAGVEIVADVRLNAVSRKPGFSKTRLSQALAVAGIEYLHLRSLGNAKENRRPFAEGRVTEGRRRFAERLRSPEAQASLEDLAGLLRSHVVALLCFESDVETCHRKVIIDHLVETTGAPVVVLEPG